MLLVAIYKFHFEVAALLKEVRRDRFMPAKLTDFARSRADRNRGYLQI